ncbi:MAG: UDP-N-acetylglucosamine 2-epimerase (non-hydrolyzing) [Lentimicrobiaceae bacterium]|nr:UDP-N-acetylglucosamine 2-epimerase (non-hydrolyzing) [Lentimicrobiaceae bacterium]
MKIVSIIGARPQIIKAAALSRAIRQYFSDELTEIIIHTGQHYDSNMSDIFFDELQIPKPHYNLQVGSDSHARQTAQMMLKIEEVLCVENPDFVVVYGDTNSTLAAAITASKLHIPIAHIEAGLRSFNKTMPEEINRILCDHCSTLLFTPTKKGLENLLKEGFSKENNKPFTADNPGIFLCGDVMYDNNLYYREKAIEKSKILNALKLENEPFVLCTIHRAENTDNAKRLTTLFETILEIAQQQKIVVPLHPRTNKLLDIKLEKTLLQHLTNNKNIILTEPVSFFDMLALEHNAQLIMTDSGGVQKEAYFFKKPSLILRNETEWTEIIDAGTAQIVDTNKEKIVAIWKFFSAHPPSNFPSIFGDGAAAQFICKTILSNKH